MKNESQKKSFIKMLLKINDGKFFLGREEISIIYNDILFFFKTNNDIGLFNYLKKSRVHIDQWKCITKKKYSPIMMFIKNSINKNSNIKYQRPKTLGDYHERFYHKYYSLYYW